MSLIKCKSCGHEISDIAKKCPNCGCSVSKKRNIIIIIICAILISMGLIMFGIIKFQQKVEQNRQAEISEILHQVDDLYKKRNFDKVAECYNELDKLSYDTTTERKILEYDKAVCEDAYNFYLAIREADEKINNGSASSLNALMKSLKNPCNKICGLEVNIDSKIGRYINEVQTNIMYETFKTQFIDSNDIDLDYSLTSWGYYIVLSTYTNEIVKIEFPYTE